MRWLAACACVLVLGCQDDPTDLPAGSGGVGGTASTGGSAGSSVGSSNGASAGSSDPFADPCEGLEPGVYPDGFEPPSSRLWDGSADAEHYVVRRSCEEERLPADYLLMPGMVCGWTDNTFTQRVLYPGIECIDSSECDAYPFGRCLTTGTPQYCSYAGVDAPEVESEWCEDDADCVTHPEGRCERFISHTTCQYNNQCTVDADCESGERCGCNGTGDLYCAAASCDSDADCGDDQRCLQDDPCGFGPNGAFVCTSTADECEAGVECADHSVCHFDADSGHFTCGGIRCLAPP